MGVETNLGITRENKKGEKGKQEEKQEEKRRGDKKKKRRGNKKQGQISLERSAS